MMKFFRKYTKHLLAVFMALLLVIWLAGDALQSLLMNRGAQDKSERGTLDGRTITQEDAAPIFQQLDVLSRPELQSVTNWKMVWLSALDELGVRDDRSGIYQYHFGILMSRGDLLDEDEWFLLVTEARRNNMFVPNEAVEEFKATKGLIGPPLSRLRQHYPMKLINEAIRSYLMVQRQAVTACKAPPVSEADVRDFVRQTSEKADVAVATLVATENSKFFDNNYAPTEEELTKLFDKHKSSANQPHSQGLDFGYQQPEAVQIEYLRINADALRNKQQIDETFAYNYWEKHKDDFTREVAPESAPASGPAPPPRRDKYPTFTEARAEVITRLQKAKANEAALRIAREIIDELTKPWATNTTRPGAEQAAPESQPAEDAYAEAHLKWSAKYPDVINRVSLPMLERDALGKNAELGQATGKVGVQQGLPLSQAAFLVEGLADAPEQGSDQLRYFRKPGQTCGVAFADAQGNAFVFRTTAIRPKQPPANLDLVRERLVADARKLHAYERAGELAKSLRERAAKEGLEAAFRNDAELRNFIDEGALRHPTPFARTICMAQPGGPPHVMPGNIQGVGSDPKLLEAVFELATARTTTQPHPVVVWDQPEQRQWLVIELRKILPPTTADYDQYRMQAVAYLQRERQKKLLVEWFDRAQIKTRLKWKSEADIREAEQVAKKG